MEARGWRVAGWNPEDKYEMLCEVRGLEVSRVGTPRTHMRCFARFAGWNPEDTYGHVARGVDLLRSEVTEHRRVLKEARELRNRK